MAWIVECFRWGGHIAFSAIVATNFAGAAPTAAKPSGQQTRTEYSYFLPWQWDAAGWSAAFTLALTVSTILLWKETRRLAKLAEAQGADTQRSLNISEKIAEAAKLSADAAIGADRPWVLVFVDDENFEEYISSFTDPAAAKHPRSFAYTDFHFENYGRTPAFIQHTFTKLVVGDSKVPPINYRTGSFPWVYGDVLDPGKRKPEKSSAHVVVEFGLDEARRFDPMVPNFDYSTAGWFWFFGRVVYADVWGNLHSTDFCLANDGYNGWEIPDRAVDYNRRN